MRQCPLPVLWNLLASEPALGYAAAAVSQACIDPNLISSSFKQHYSTTPRHERSSSPRSLAPAPGGTDRRAHDPARVGHQNSQLHDRASGVNWSSSNRSAAAAAHTPARDLFKRNEPQQEQDSHHFLQLQDLQRKQRKQEARSEHPLRDLQARSGSNAHSSTGPSTRNAGRGNTTASTSKSLFEEIARDSSGSSGSSSASGRPSLLALQGLLQQPDSLLLKGVRSSVCSFSSLCGCFTSQLFALCR